MKTELLFLNEQTAQKGAELIKSGEIVAMPTETVYGLGANAFNEAAVKKIFEAKGRPSDNPLIVHVASKEQICTVASEIPPAAQLLIEKFMPGPITVVLPKHKEIPYSVTGGLETVGVRIPAHKQAQMFLEACGCPVCAPSANSSGKPSPTTAMHVFDDLNGKIPLILDGGSCQGGIESTVISLCGETPLLLRPGLITVEMLEAVLGKINVHPAILKDECVDKAASPGMKYKHYSPKARVLIVDASIDCACSFYDFAAKNGKKPIILWNDDQRAQVGSRNFEALIENGDMLSASKNLFALLRKADDQGFDTVFITAVNQKDTGLSIMNRMLRAAAFTVLTEKTQAEQLKSILGI